MDTTRYSPIINHVTDNVLLQDDLDTLIEWAMTWQMDLMKVDKYCYVGVYLQNKYLGLPTLTIFHIKQIVSLAF